MELLVHLNKRIKSRPKIQLPVETLLVQYQDPAAASFVTVRIQFCHTQLINPEFYDWTRSWPKWRILWDCWLCRFCHLKNFTIIYIKMGYPRLEVGKQCELAPTLLTAMEGKPQPQQDRWGLTHTCKHAHRGTSIWLLFSSLHVVLFS